MDTFGNWGPWLPWSLVPPPLWISQSHALSIIYDIATYISPCQQALHWTLQGRGRPQKIFHGRGANCKVSSPAVYIETPKTSRSDEARVVSEIETPKASCETEWAGEPPPQSLLTFLFCDTKLPSFENSEKYFAPFVPFPLDMTFSWGTEMLFYLLSV